MGTDKELRERIAALEDALDAFLHAYEDSIDDYPALSEAAERAKALLPHYTPT